MGVAAPTPNYFKDLLVGDSRDFAASLGAWVNTGGTLSRDTGYQITNLVASLKYIATANTQYCEVDVPGTFLANIDYFAVLFLSLEETSGNHAANVVLGLQGTDTATGALSIGGDAQSPMVGDGNFLAMYVRWRPTANRTGVKLRLANNAAVASTWHIGLARVFRQPNDYYGGPPLLTDPTNGRALIPMQTASGIFGPWAGSGSGFQFASNGSMGIFEGAGQAGFDTGSSFADPNFNTYVQAPHTAGDLAGFGHQTNVGADYVGYYTSEKDSDTVQFYADVAGGYMMQLRNRGSGKGWSVSDDGTLNQKVTDTFQWTFYVSGVQSTGTDKAAYFQVPEKCKIDEVRIHLGTAPTGTNFIVDVNDDGVTIFTSQGNRPEIAVSTNNDTSGAPDGGTAVAKDSVLTIDVDQIGSGTPGSDLVVFVRGRFIW